MCPAALVAASLQGRTPERHMSYNSGSCFPTERAPVPPPHALRFPMGHDLKHKQKTSMSAYADRLACSELTHACFQGV
jgi:hypothetical protein